jgi:outer membrane immunogenic protein
MNTKLNLTLGAAAAALLAATSISLAADAVFEAPPAPPAAPIMSAPINTWEGGYAGISLGYGFSGETDIAPAVGTGGGTVDTDGFVGNVFGGWNWQSGSFVYGIEGDVGYNGMEDDNFNYNVENGVDGTLRARLGVAATENVLVYATAGGAGGRTEVTAPGGASDTQTLWGWTAGVGTDVKFTEQAFGRLEYRYTDLGDETFDLGAATADVGSTSHKVLVGVGMKF